MEDGKFGDQRYLDDWLDRFNSVVELQNLGGGVAPWNVQQYDITSKRGPVVCKEKQSGDEFSLIFYHFHGVTCRNDGKLTVSKSYFLDKKVKKYIAINLRLGNYEKIYSKPTIIGKIKLYMIKKNFIK